MLSRTHNMYADSEPIRSSRKYSDLYTEITKRNMDALNLLFFDHIHKPFDVYKEFLNAIQGILQPSDLELKLIESLHVIDRNDLVYNLGFNPEEIRLKFVRGEYNLSKYRVLLHTMADSLDSKELGTLKRNVASIIDSSNIISNHRLFCMLEKCGKISINNLAYLSQLLQYINRPDLVQQIKEAEPFKEIQEENKESIVASSKEGFNVHMFESLSTEEKKENFIKRLENINLSESGADHHRDDLPRYSMNSKISGICVIINNENFSEQSKLDQRLGSQIDVDKLHWTFERLSFRVVIYKDLSTDEMFTVLKRHAEDDHQNYDAFVCCISTHGKPGRVHGIDGNLINILNLTSLFKPDSCPSLTGKPKLFFIQACRGPKSQKGSYIETDNGGSGEQASVPNEADFLYGYATVFGFVSYRHQLYGSWYILALTYLLDQLAHRYDLMSILTEVNNIVSTAEAFDEGLKMIPAPVTTLRKMVYFKLQQS